MRAWLAENIIFVFGSLSMAALGGGHVIPIPFVCGGV